MLAAVTVWGTGCSAAAPPPAPAGSGPSATSPAPGPGDAVERRTVCYVDPPAAWTAARQARRVALPDGVNVGLNAVAGGSAHGQVNTSSGSRVARVDLTAARLSAIAPIARDAGGVGAMGVQLPWIVWEQLDSQTRLEIWSIHAFNQATGAGRSAGSRPDRPADRSSAPAR